MYRMFSADIIIYKLFLLYTINYPYISLVCTFCSFFAKKGLKFQLVFFAFHENTET